jgi:hypothetical protein
MVVVAAMTFGLGNISSRHLYLITVPTSILWAIALVTLVDVTPTLLARLGIRKRAANTLRFVPTLLLGSALVLSGLGYSAEIQAAWGAATGHTDNLLAQVEQHAQAHPAATTLYLIDMPDYTVAPNGDHVYLFRNAPQASVRMTIPGRFRAVVAVRTSNAVPISRGYTVLMDSDQLARLSSQRANLLLQYTGATGTLQRWQAPRILRGPLATGAVPAGVPMGELVDGREFQQTFVSMCGNLRGIELLTATYARTNSHPVIVRLRDTTTGQFVLEQTLPSATIPNNGWLKFAFAPLPDSLGRTFLITVESPKSMPGDAITVWRSKTDMYPKGQAAINGNSVTADLAFGYDCQP